MILKLQLILKSGHACTCEYILFSHDPNHSNLAKFRNILWKDQRISSSYIYLLPENAAGVVMHVKINKYLVANFSTIPAQILGGQNFNAF